MGPPSWWDELAEDLAQLSIVLVDVLAAEDSDEWTGVVFFDGHSLVAPADLAPRVDSVHMVWTLGARRSEADAWRALETFLRGVVEARRRTLVAVPPVKRQAGGHEPLCSQIRERLDRWRLDNWVVAEPS